MPLEWIVGVSFEPASGVIVDLANPLTGQAQSLSDFLAAVALKVNREKYLQVPIIQYLPGEITKLKGGLQCEILVLWITPDGMESLKEGRFILTISAYPVSITRH